MAIQWLKLQQACKKGQVEDSIIEEMQCLTFKNCSCTSLHWEFGKKGHTKNYQLCQNAAGTLKNQPYTRALCSLETIITILKREMDGFNHLFSNFRTSNQTTTSLHLQKSLFTTNWWGQELIKPTYKCFSNILIDMRVLNFKEVPYQVLLILICLFIHCMLITIKY